MREGEEEDMTDAADRDAAPAPEGDGAEDALYAAFLRGFLRDVAPTSLLGLTVRHAWDAALEVYGAARPAPATDGAEAALEARLDEKGFIGLTTRAIYRDGWMDALAWRAAPHAPAAELESGAENSNSDGEDAGDCNSPAPAAEGADTLETAYRAWLVGRYGDRVMTTNPRATFYGEMRHAFEAGAAWPAARAGVPAVATEGDVRHPDDCIPPDARGDGG